MAAAVLALAMLVAGDGFAAAPATAEPTVVSGRIGVVDPVVGLASNTNSAMVAGVGRDGTVVVRVDSAAGWTNIGRPVDGGPLRVDKLAVTLDRVYALNRDRGVYRWRSATGWQVVLIGSIFVDLLASRSGRLVPAGNNSGEFEPTCT